MTGWLRGWVSMYLSQHWLGFNGVGRTRSRYTNPGLYRSRSQQTAIEGRRVPVASTMSDCPQICIALFLIERTDVETNFAILGKY